jgi:hypothetical protein
MNSFACTASLGLDAKERSVWIIGTLPLRDCDGHDQILFGKTKDVTLSIVPTALVIVQLCHGRFPG